MAPGGPQHPSSRALTSQAPAGCEITGQGEPPCCDPAPSSLCCSSQSPCPRAPALDSPRPGPSLALSCGRPGLWTWRSLSLCEAVKRDHHRSSPTVPVTSREVKGGAASGPREGPWAPGHFTPHPHLREDRSTAFGSGRGGVSRAGRVCHLPFPLLPKPRSPSWGLGKCGLMWAVLCHSGIVPHASPPSRERQTEGEREPRARQGGSR